MEFLSVICNISLLLGIQCCGQIWCLSDSFSTEVTCSFFLEAYKISLFLEFKTLIGRGLNECFFSQYCIFLTTNDVEHLSVSVMVTCLSSLKVCLFKWCVHFLPGYLPFYCGYWFFFFLTFFVAWLNLWLPNIFWVMVIIKEIHSSCFIRCWKKYFMTLMKNGNLTFRAE